MDELKKIAKIVTLFSANKLPVFDFNHLRIENKEELLLKNILENKYNNDKEAHTDIYGVGADTYPYRMLKSRIKKKLYSHLHFISNHTKASKKEEKKCYDMLYQGKVLMNLAEYKLAESIYQKTLPLSKKYEFTSVTIECYEHLNFIYAQLAEYKLFYSSLDKLSHYRKLKGYEDEAYNLYFTSKLELTKSVASKKKYLLELPNILSNLNNLWTKSNSYNVFEYYHHLNTWYLKLKGDYLASIRNLETCEMLLKEGKLNKFRFDERANKYSHISALLKAHQYEKGLKLAEGYLASFNPYSRNWFAFMEFYFLLSMHAENYQLATDIMFQVDSNPYYKRLKTRAVENWMLYKAYLYFMYSEAKFIKKFNFQDFIIAVPEHTKDKLGYNVAIHILQFFHHLKNKDFDQLYYKEGALRKYLNTYLKDPNSQRSRYFFKLLIVAIRADFNIIKIQKKAAVWEAKLKETPTPGDAYAEIEIIPYEKLWQIILNFLKNNSSSQVSA